MEISCKCCEVYVHLRLGWVLYIVTAGLYKIVVYSALGAFQDIYIPENTAHAELVLILQIASVAPFEDQHAEPVGAVSYEFGYVKFTG